MGHYFDEHSANTDELPWFLSSANDTFARSTLYIGVEAPKPRPLLPLLFPASPARPEFTRKWKMFIHRRMRASFLSLCAFPFVSNKGLCIHVRQFSNAHDGGEVRGKMFLRIEGEALETRLHRD